MVNIYIKQIRSDGKTPVFFSFDNGRVIKKLIPNKEFATVDAIRARFPDAIYPKQYN